MTQRLRLLAPLPLLTACAFGLATLAGPQAALADPPTITILSPASGAIVGNSVNLQADIVSPIYQITSVNAQTAFGTSGLSRSGNTWSGFIPLPATNAGNQTITLIATYSGSQKATASVTVLHDLPPDIHVNAPADGTVVLSNDTLPIDASCIDDAPSGCTVEVVYRNTVIASGPSPLVTAVALPNLPRAGTPYDDTVFLRARDAVGQTQQTYVRVYGEPSSAALTEIDHVPAGIIREFNDAFITYDDPASVPYVYDRATKQSIRGKAFLTPFGTLVLSDSGLAKWSGGVLTYLEDPLHPNHHIIPSLPMAGNDRYVAWTEENIDIPKHISEAYLYRYDMMTGATDLALFEKLIVWLGYINVVGVSANGDLFIKRGSDSYYDTGRFVLGRYDVASGNWLGGLGDCVSVNVVSGDHLVGASCATQDGPFPTKVAISSATAPEMFTEISTSVPTFFPHIFVSGDWTAYEQNDGTSTQVWRRAPDGSVEQVSVLGGNSALTDAPVYPSPYAQLIRQTPPLSPTGEVSFYHDGERYFARPGSPPVPGGPNAYFNGNWYLRRGRSLFLYNANATGGSTTGTGAGGAGGTGNSSGSAGSTSASSASNAAGAGGTSPATGAGGASSSSEQTSSSAGGSGATPNGSSTRAGCSVASIVPSTSLSAAVMLLGLTAFGLRRRRARRAA